MKALSLKALLAGVALAASASLSAQTTEVTEIVVATTSCDSVTYSQKILDRFPEANQACQEVLEFDDKLYTRVDAKLRESSLSGKFRVQLKLRDGSYGPTRHVKKSASVGAWSNGERVSFGDLRPNQVVSVYLPHDRFDLVWDITVIDVVTELPETAGSLHWLALIGLGLFGMAGMSRRWRKKS